MDGEEWSGKSEEERERGAKPMIHGYIRKLKLRPRHPRGNTQGEPLTGNVFSGALDDRHLNKVTNRGKQALAHI
jgi:hypothetical protein